MRPGHLWLAAFVCIVLLGTRSARADLVSLSLHPDGLGPFPAGVGGFIDYRIAVEFIDAEGDGPDTQGLAGVVFDILTDTGLEHPSVPAALTGEFGYNGMPARAWDPLYELSDSPEDRFVGGFGLTHVPIPGGSAIGDDRVVNGWFIPIIWIADAQPNRPGLQPPHLVGIGYDERPAGGPWYLGETQVPIPLDPGIYTVSLNDMIVQYLRPDVDLGVDQDGGFRMAAPEEDILGDSFSFTVLPEPTGVGLGVLSSALLALLRPRRD